MKLLFIVSGEDAPVEAEPELPLEWAARRALRVSRNTLRPVEQWECRDERGAPLSFETSVGDLGVRHIYLTPQLGCGGEAELTSEVIMACLRQSAPGAAELLRTLNTLSFIPRSSLDLVLR